MERLSEPRNTDENKNAKSKALKKEIRQVIEDIRHLLSFNKRENERYLKAFDDMIEFDISDYLEMKDITYDILSEFEILTNFYQVDEAKEEILNIFVEFFKNIMNAKINKNAIVIRYENYLKAIQLLEHAFYFSYDTCRDLFIDDKFNTGAGNITEHYEQFKKTADEYFKPFKEHKDQYDLLNHTQGIRDKLSNAIVLKAEMYQITGIDKNKKARLANKIYKYFNPNDKDT